MDNDQRRSKQRVFSEWIPREAGGRLDWSKVQVAPPGVVDASGRPWMKLRVQDETGSDYVLFRLL